MKQLSDFRYEVASGEKVKLVFKPVGLAPELITAALDNGPIDPNPETPNPTYRFTVDLPNDQTHFFKVECDFVEVEDNAHVDVEITGKKGTSESGPFIVTINNTDSIHDPVFRFRVKNSAS